MKRRETDGDNIYEDKNKSGSTFAGDLKQSVNTAEWDALGNTAGDGRALVEILGKVAKETGEGNVFFGCRAIPIGTHIIDVIETTDLSGAVWSYSFKNGVDSGVGQWTATTDGSSVVNTLYSVEEGTVSGITAAITVAGGYLCLEVTVADTGWEMKVVRDTIRDDGVAEQLTYISANTTITIDGVNGDDRWGDGGSTKPYATLARGMADLVFKRIREGYAVTFDIKEDVYNLSSPVALNHIDGDKVIFQGETSAGTMSAVSVSGSAGARTMYCTVDDTAGMAIGDVLIISGASSGTYPEYTEGAFRISAVDDSTHVTVTYNSEGVYVPTGSVSATITRLLTRFHFSTSDGFVPVMGRHGGTLKNLAITANGSNDGVFATDGAIIEIGDNVGIVNWNICLKAYNTGLIIAPTVQVSHGVTYLVMTTGLGNIIIDDNSARASCGGGYGTIGFNNGRLTYKGEAFGCAYYGILSFSGSIVEAEGSESSNNAIAGYYVDGPSILNAESATANRNITVGFYAGYRGYIWTTSTTGTGNGTLYSPAQNARGNAYAYNDA